MLFYSFFTGEEKSAVFKLVTQPFFDFEKGITSKIYVINAGLQCRTSVMEKSGESTIESD